MPTPRHSNWKPLLEGRQQREALEAVDAIADVARSAIDAWSERHQDPSGANAHSLAWGRSGTALFYAYRDAAQGRGNGGADAFAVLNRAIEAMNDSTPAASLFVGFTGVAWVSEHLDAMSRQRSGDDGEDPNADVDAALIDHLAEPRPHAEWDLVEGLVGLGVYAIERLPRASGRRVLELVIARLAELAQPVPPGLTWPTPPGRPVADHVRDPQARYDVGLAHGIPGIVALLGLAIEADVDVERCRQLLEGAVRWLLAQRLPRECVSCFPSHVGTEADAAPARCAWCYGDPGVAIALWGAARRAGMADVERAALGIARHAAEVRERRDDVRDAQLCHGSAGVAHLFHRLHRATGDASAKAAALYWFERTLEFRRPGAGLAGFRTWSLERTLEGEWIDDPRFLTGIVGVGLALLAAATDVEPAWDRVLLASLPPR